MKKIQCPECGRVKGENDKHCLDCGYVFDSVKKEEKIVTKVETNNNNSIIPYINYIIVGLNIIYFLGLYKLPMVITHNSGRLPLFSFAKSYTNLHNVGEIYNYCFVAVIVLLVLNLIFVFINEKTKKLSRIFYLLTFIFECLFVFLFYMERYEFIIINTLLIFIIPLVMFILLLKSKKAKKETSNYVKKIKELKELFDSGAISKEEFEKYKKDILDKEMK